MHGPRCILSPHRIHTEERHIFPIPCHLPNPHRRPRGLHRRRWSNVLGRPGWLRSSPRPSPARPRPYARITSDQCQLIRSQRLHQAASRSRSSYGSRNEEEAVRSLSPVHSHEGTQAHLRPGGQATVSNHYDCMCQSFAVGSRRWKKHASVCRNAACSVAERCFHAVRSSFAHDVDKFTTPYMDPTKRKSSREYLARNYWY